MPLNEGEIGVTIVIIPHNNHNKFKTRLERDVLPTIAAHASWKFQIVVIDNSDLDKRPVYEVVEGHNLEHVYKWPGTNIMYGPAMNLALESCIYPYLVYVCSNHGHMYDPTWLDDLINPLITDPKIAMTGCHYPSGSPEPMGFSSNLPQIHIQGGVFGAKTEVLIKHPYTTDQRWMHWGSDIYQSFQLLNAGFYLHNVPTIKSVWRQQVSEPEQWKFVHDYSED